MFIQKPRLRSRDPGRVALALLMAIVYLTVFLAHDLVFAERPSWPQPAEAASALASADSYAADSNSGLEHHCPFCSGFVDTHTEPVVIWGNVPVSDKTTTQNELLQPVFTSSQHPRGPPQNFA